MKRLYVTLDTEMDSDEKWRKKYPPEYTSVTDGIPQLLRPIWDRLDVHPIYFVSPEVLYNEQCCEVLCKETEKGAVIGAHLHPEYIEPDSVWGKDMEKTPAQFPCYACSDQTEKEKLKNLTALIQEKLGVKPEWYRAARFGADIHTIEILRELGYRYDSSVTPQINWKNKGGPDHSMAPDRPYYISDDDMYKPQPEDQADKRIQEFPVTIFGRRCGLIGKLLPDHWLFYRWLRPTHMTYLELKGIINRIRKEKIRNPVMMFHSMEIMIHKTPYVRSRFMQRYYLWRLEKTLEYAKKSGYLL